MDKFEKGIADLEEETVEDIGPDDDFVGSQIRKISAEFDSLCNYYEELSDKHGYNVVAVSAGMALNRLSDQRWMGRLSDVATGRYKKQPELER